MHLAIYKHFTSIIQEVNPIKIQNASDPNQTIDGNVTTLRQNIQLLQLKGENISKEEVYEMILYGVADKLAASMKSDQAVLVSKYYHNFLIQSLTNLRTTLRSPPLNKQIPLAIAGFFL